MFDIKSILGYNPTQLSLTSTIKELEVLEDRVATLETQPGTLDVLKSFVEYLELEKDGRIIKLPGKVGDILYIIENKDKDHVYSMLVGGSPIDHFYIRTTKATRSELLAYVDKFGERVFIDEDAAYEKLKELNKEMGL